MLCHYQSYSRLFLFSNYPAAVFEVRDTVIHNSSFLFHQRTWQLRLCDWLFNILQYRFCDRLLNHYQGRLCDRLFNNCLNWQLFSIFQNLFCYRLFSIFQNWPYDRLWNIYQGRSCNRSGKIIDSLLLVTIICPIRANLFI